MQLKDILIENVLFLDIETTPNAQHMRDLVEDEKREWSRKCMAIRQSNYENDSALFESKATLYPEFAKVICISIGMIREGILYIKSFSNEKEIDLLNEFVTMLNGTKEGTVLCAHNGKNFDFPFLCKRIMINKIPMPALLNVYGKKPWEITHLDTREIWGNGGKDSASLSTLCYVFGIPTPKDDIDGSQVKRVYYEEKDLPRIVKYCQKDVVATVNVLLTMRYDIIIPEDKIVIR